MDEPDVPSDNPYPGLRPFLGAETHLFFGRDDQRVELLRRLRLSRFLAIVGSSGSGKSSLVRAGLLPGLHGGFMAGRGGDWRVADLRPGTDPIGNLARALDRPDVLHDEADGDPGPSYTETTLRRSAQGLVEAVREARLPAADKLLVLVDQFEELFRGLEARDSASAHDDASAFVKLLLAASGQAELNIYVVLTMRSDFLGDCARFRGLPEAINQGQYLIPRLTRDQIAEAITGPAAVMGATLSPPLVNRLLNDVGDNPDQLPILQHALMRTWDEWARRGRPDGLLALDHYLDVGGMAQALNRHADEVLAGLAEGLPPLPAARRSLVAKRIFQALTDTHTAGRKVRRLARLAEVAAEAGATVDEVLAVVAPFRQPRNAFLMPPANEPATPDTDLDLSHESLMRNWATLQGWQREEAASATQYLRLAETAARHGRRQADTADREGRRPLAGLLDEPDLGEALRWRKARQPTAAWAHRYGGHFKQAMDFLDASRNEALRADNQRRRNRRVRTSVVGLVLSVLLVTALAWVAIDLERIDEQADKADEIRHTLDMTATMRRLVDERSPQDGAAGVTDCADARTYNNETEKTKTEADAAWERAYERWGRHWLPVYLSVCKEIGILERDDLLLLELAEALHKGDVATADQLVQTEPGKFAIPAHQLMDDLARMQDNDLRNERRWLVAQRHAKADAPAGASSALRAPGNLFRTTETPLVLQHPIHRHIASQLKPPAGLSASERWLLDRYARQQTKGKGTRDEQDRWKQEIDPKAPCADRSTVPVPEGLASLYIGMCEAANQPESRLAGLRADLRDTLQTWWLELLVLLTWPLWRLRRWWQRRQGVVIESKPHPLRRALAMVFDAMALVGIVWAASMVWTTVMSVVFNDRADALDWAAAIVSVLGAVAYALFGDLLRFRYSRSIGKIAFDLRPLRDREWPRGGIPAGTSARRNAPMLGWMLVLVILLAATDHPDDALTRALYYLAALALTLAPNLLMRSRSWPDRWSKTTLVDTDSAESLAAELPPRYCPEPPAAKPVNGAVPPLAAAVQA